MDKGQSEITERIRSAIKKKLVEINAFVDDELPDYIMILVANKRSKSHMKKDLSLFLGKDTASFTDWLWELVSNLKVKPSTKQSKNEEPNQGDKSIPSDEDVLDYDPNEQEGELLYQEDNSNSQNQQLILKEKPLSKDYETLPSTTQLVKPLNKDSVKELHHSPNQKAVKVYPVQPISRTNPNAHIESNINPEDEYDPTKPDFTGTVSSVVHVTERKYSRPAALQVNKLLMRAVDDATKSVLDGKSVDEFYKPTPIKVLSSTRRDAKYPTRSNLVNVKIDPHVNTVGVLELSDVELHSNGDLFNRGNFNFSETPQQNSRTICLAADQAMKKEMTLFPDEHSGAATGQEVKEDPHFIVTLDGVHLPSLKRKFVDSEESMDEDDENVDDINVQDENMEDDDEEEDYEANPEKRLKATEKCKYWPACKNSNNCNFHHPTVPCKCFPDCKYGDKCLYIHPNCKFDALCSRKDCPYTHASKRKYPLQVPIPKPIINPRSTKIVCKFYPKCTVKNCAFVHPKFCRYGTTCRIPNCAFTHLNIPPRNQMKWKAKASESL